MARRVLSRIALLLLLPLMTQHCTCKSRAMPIQVGQTVEGRLEEGDWTDVFGDSSFTDLYEIHLEAGQGITAEMSSEDFDTYLSVLRGPGDQLVDNDDIAPGNTNSRLSYRAQASGQFFVAATSFRTGASGSYTVTVSELRPGESDSDDDEPGAPSTTPDASLTKTDS